MYSTRISPSVQRLRKRQYVRARRSRCFGVQIAVSAALGMRMSADCTERHAPVRSIDVSSCSGPIVAGPTVVGLPSTRVRTRETTA